MYGASEGLATVVLDSIATRGQASLSTRIENYLGFPAGLSGAELAERAVLQAEKFGADLCVPAEAVALGHQDGFHAVRLSDGSTMTARAVVIATGVRYRRLPVPDVERFEATSVYYAATLVEATSASASPLSWSVAATRPARLRCSSLPGRRRCGLVVRESDLGANMSRYLVDRLQRMPGVEILLDSEVRRLEGDRFLRRVEVENPGRRAGMGRRPGGVRVHRRRTAHPLARRQGRLDECGFGLAGHPGGGASPPATVPAAVHSCSRRPLRACSPSLCAEVR